MQSRPTIAMVWLLALAVVGGAMASEAQGQRLLERLEQRIRNRIEAAGALEPTGANAPPLTPPPAIPSAAAPPSPSPVGGPSAAPVDRVGAQRPDASEPPVLGIEAEERLAPGGAVHLVVVRVRPGTAAEQAGIRAGDVLHEVDDRAVGSLEEVSRLLAARRPGDSLPLLVERSGRPLRLTAQLVTPENAPAVFIDQPPEGAGRLGVTVENIRRSVDTAGLQRGALVVDVRDGSPAATLGLRPGDVIVSFEGRLVGDAASLIREVSATRPGQQIELGYYQQGRLVRAPVVLQRPEQWGAAESSGRSLGAAPPEGEGPPPPGPAAPGEAAPGDAPQAPPGEETARGGAAAPSAEPSILGGLGRALGGFFGSEADRDAAEARSEPPRQPGEPAAAQPPISQPPVSQPPVSQPPISQPLAAEPPPAPSVPAPSAPVESAPAESAPAEERSPSSFSFPPAEVSRPGAELLPPPQSRHRAADEPPREDAREDAASDAALPSLEDLSDAAAGLLGGVGQRLAERPLGSAPAATSPPSLASGPDEEAVQLRRQIETLRQQLRQLERRLAEIDASAD